MRLALSLVQMKQQLMGFCFNFESDVEGELASMSPARSYRTHAVRINRIAARKYDQRRTDRDDSVFVLQRDVAAED